MTRYFQQGDELFYADETLPKGAKPDKTGVLLASPVTGHAHRLKSGKLLRTETDRFVVGPAVVVHEEHKDVVLPEGVYRMGTVQEYDHLTEESRNVID